nr:unnamed protein product [Spirometra erinaceieuropaei]
MLAETADRILEYYQPPVTVNVASRSTTVPTIEDVVKRLDALTLEVSQLRATRVYNPRSPAISRRPRSPTPNKPTADAVEAFNRARKALADTTVLVHPIPDAPLSIVADASNFAIGAALQQQTPTGTQPLAFYSAKLTPPQTRYSNFVERFHRQLKASLRAHDNPSHWSEHLPLVMLGIRTALKPDLECSAAELVYGTTLRIPGDFFGYSQSSADLDPSDYVQRLRQAMTHLRATPPRPSTNSFRRPIQQPYDGLFRVLSRKDKYFTIDRGGRTDVVSIDRLKAAYTEPLPTSPIEQPPLGTLPLAISQTPFMPNNPASSLIPQTPPLTRSGRHVRFPDRYQLVQYA